MTTFEIPLTPEPQRFEVDLGGRAVRMTLRWKEVDEGGWSLDLDGDDGAPIIGGLPLVTGIDLLEQYQIGRAHV